MVSSSGTMNHGSRFECDVLGGVIPFKNQCAFFRIEIKFEMELFIRGAAVVPVAAAVAVCRYMRCYFD